MDVRQPAKRWMLSSVFLPGHAFGALVRVTWRTQESAAKPYPVWVPGHETEAGDVRTGGMTGWPSPA
jgi:hypothetical protein